MDARILLIRHAETQTPDRFHGAESDIGLGDRGRRQAVHLAGAIAAEGPGLVIASAMRRALETARPVAEAAGVPLRVVEALHERRMPTLSGRAKAEAWGIYESTMARWMAGDLDHAETPGDESYSQVRDRVVPAFLGAIEGSRGRTTVVILHGLVIRVLLTILLPDLGPADFGRVGIDNCAINDLRWDGECWRAEALNRTPEGLP